MELASASTAFQALAHETRLRAFRLIVESGADGIAAGEIARALAVPASTLSTHLALLERAELIGSTRRHRSIFYAVDASGVQAVIDFLTRDCCGGAPELCGFGSLLAGNNDNPSTETARDKQ